ncbi:MAG: excinuclease ABC subunit UvrA [Geobacteraceae bacterium]|nr:excinuclease ABC subunit UvrA [Geobacteraceae bacterium]
MANDSISIRGARQNNLKGLDLDIPLGELTVVTGVSGSGKSSLAFDTVYAEGQRRYVETFSPYARQFLERMDRPRADRIEGIPPAIAIDQTNPVRTSRSTVGTMTELADHLKLLFARAARIYCKGCGREVRRDTPDSIFAELLARPHPAFGHPLPEGEGSSSPLTVLVTFPVQIPANFTGEEVKGFLAGQGYTRIHREDERLLEVVQDRTLLTAANRPRLVEGLEAALSAGRGRLLVYPLDSAGAPGEPWRFSGELHCPDCDISYGDPQPNLFSFNSPVGACGNCRGFGRVIGVDYGLVVPDDSRSLAGGAVRPWQSESYRECRDDLLRFAGKRQVPTDVPWRELSDTERQWVLEGEGPWEDGLWYGVRRFFDWLESKSYKMHIRVLLSRYRAYTPCPACRGARLKPDALFWRLGTREEADLCLAPARRFRPEGAEFSDRVLRSLPGLTLHDVMLLPIERCRAFFEELTLPAPLDEAAQLLLRELRTRLGYLVEVGLPYLTLDRQSRTLSGGEVQRINLTTALGTSLVNTLFVLDEPSIGLHPRDMGKVIGVLRRLRDAGNTLLVVEHDPQVMLAADRVLDLGPGPGERGGEVVFFGTPAELLRAKRSLTGQYLSGKKRVDAGSKGSEGEACLAPTKDYIEILGASAHNLQGIDVRIPLNRLVCITGVSGSGKSTLVQEVLHRGLLKRLGRPTEAAGEHRAIRGSELIGEVILVDQSPIGRTTRSNPASYVGAFDAIRKLFAAEPLAKERGYTAGAFSFNSGSGRCSTCGGNGFEHVEMQFLADVYLRCPDCDGRRYRAELLEVTLVPAAGGKPVSIADVLEMTVTEAVAFFADRPEVLRGLEPLEGVGLGYLRLGQPVPTLSGGEAQRLKLAGHLAKARKDKGGSRSPVPGPQSLFLFDEPTTGLHFEDIARLLAAFCRLLAAGDSLVVIEHNLDVIRAADWLIDLGPEGGDGGGRVVCTGTPAAAVACPESHTGLALREYEEELRAIRKMVGRGAWHAPSTGRTPSAPAISPLPGCENAICILKAREHNLQNVDITIPRDRFTVITGISGSGKSTVAFDILFAEGQRRYLESLNAYARQFVQPAARPDVDAVTGIPPTVAIEQRTSRGGRKSTVATLTEIHHFLRLLFVKLGVQHCPDCGSPISPQNPDAIVARLLRDLRGRTVLLLAPLVVARKGYYTDLAKWAAAKGFAELRVDGVMTPTSPWPRLDRFREHSIELPLGEIEVTPEKERELRELLDRALAFGKGVVKVFERGSFLPPLQGEARVGDGGRRSSKPHPHPDLPPEGEGVQGKEMLFSTLRACASCGKSFPEPDPRLFSYNSKHGWCPRCFGTGLLLPGFDEEQTGEEIWWNAWWEGEERVCPVCDGSRLNPEALAVRFRERNIAEIGALPVTEAAAFFRGLALAGREGAIARDLKSEIEARLSFLEEVGLGYLSLDRGAPTLSGGEAQRIRLAAQLGSNLRGVCYILDEPTIGLHPRDNRMLLDTLRKLEGKGNTVVVVEHDEETIRRAEHLIDLGPGGGVNGGRVVAAGTLAEVMASPESVTGHFLAQPLRHPFMARRPAPAGDEPAIEVSGASLHNLKGISATIPLGRLVCVTGVSGSGKSTLVREVMHANLRMLLSEGRNAGAHGRAPLRGCHEIHGWENIARVLEVDQTPIGKTPRSCPATYVGFWDAIRRLFAQTPEARMRGYTPSRFSFNVKGGRCPECEGQGIKTIGMSFLPDVKVACEACGGARFTPETLMVRFKGRSIGELLAMSVDEAVDFFAQHRQVHHPLLLLREVGLGYLTLGQQSPTLSGGEAQRIKLVTELAKAREAPSPLTPHSSLYLLDEPTIGLHMADVERLVRVLHRLVAAGNSVVVIEHNLDVVAEADWIIDLGPEGGDGGGRIVAEGTPEQVARVGKGSHTGMILAEFLRERGKE